MDDDAADAWRAFERKRRAAARPRTPPVNDVGVFARATPTWNRVSAARWGRCAAAAIAAGLDDAAVYDAARIAARYGLRALHDARPPKVGDWCRVEGG